MINKKAVMLILIFGVIFSTMDRVYSTGISLKDSMGSEWSWEFNNWNDSEGWTIPESMNGGIMGGAIWLMIHPELEKLKPVSWKQQVWGPNLKYDLESPKGLAIPAVKVNKILIRVRNLSPETDGYVVWRTEKNPETDAGRARFTMQPDCNEWQEVICHMDGSWKGIINQIRIRPAQLWWRGDIWIDRIAITLGDPKPNLPRPDVCSDRVVPLIDLPGISQQDFQDAFHVLDECLVVDVPMRGFNYPFMAPGGAYGENWWQLDGSLNVAGAKWVNQKHVEDVMRGFAEVQAQNPDGRIDLWGGSPMRGQVADVSSIPRYFEAAFDVARRTGDTSLQDLIYQTMENYLRYWFSPVKRDKKTGLITAVFEETLSEPHTNPGIVAPVDLNIAVAIGCYNTSRLAEHLCKKSESRQFAQRFDRLCQSINRYLWNEEQGIYYNYNIREDRQHRRLLCTTFDPMQFGIAPAERIERLLNKLLNPALFYWNSRPVTTIARTEPDFIEATGPYDGSAWFGDIWTMRNMPIIAGLEDAGRHDLAAELSWSTIKTFNSNYCEYVVPSTGSGEGVQRYGWTASQYVQAIIEHLFGIDYDRLKKRLRIVPHIPDKLKNQKISINNLIIPAEHDVRLHLTIDQTSMEQVTIDIKISGSLPKVDLEVFLPTYHEKKVQVQNRQGELIPVVKEVKDLLNVVGVRLPIQRSVNLQFIFK